LGYAKQSGIPFELGIIRNHYIRRTFIEPTQALKNMKVKMKLSPISSLIKGKNLVEIETILL
jgi:amidophosphoribosyltransferase